MVKTKLVEQLIVDGAKLLCELDRDNFPVESMFWVDLADRDYWRLVIGSRVVAKVGSAAAYRQLDEALRRVNLSGLTLEDISLMDTNSPQLESLRSLASSSNRLATGKSWVVFENAVLYRWNDEFIQGDLTCDVSAADLNHFWSAERELGTNNEPALLISLQGRRVTLRFHPQHGPYPGIENIRSTFVIALHRPGARPDCQIVWISPAK